MNANLILSHSLTVLADEYHRYNALHEDNPYMGYADRANAIYNAMHALNELHAIKSTQSTTQTPNRLRTALNRIVGGAK